MASASSINLLKSAEFTLLKKISQLDRSIVSGGLKLCRFCFTILLQRKAQFGIAVVTHFFRQNAGQKRY